MTLITAYRDRTHGWVYCFSPSNPWSMPQGPLPSPWTYDAEFETVAADVMARFDGYTVNEEERHGKRIYGRRQDRYN